MSAAVVVVTSLILTATTILLALGMGEAGAVTGLRVTAQSSFVTANGSFVVEVAIDGLVRPPAGPGDSDGSSASASPTDGDGDSDGTDPADGLELAVAVFDRLLDESGVDEPPTGAADRLEPVALGDLTVTERGRYRLEIPVRSGDPIDDVPRLVLPEPGVYPVSIELRNIDGVIATTRTNLIRLADQPGADDGPGAADQSDTAPSDQLDVAVVVPVVPADGITVADVEQLLTIHPDLALTVLLGDGVIAQLEDDPALVDSFAAALGDRPLVAKPVVNLDPSALAAIDRLGLYTRAVDETAHRLRTLGLEPDPSIAVVDQPLTAAGAAALFEAGVRVVIDGGTSPAVNGYVDVDGRRLHLVRYDDPVSGSFNELSTAVLQSNEAMARVVIRGQTSRSPIVIGGAALGDRPTAGLNGFFHALSRTGAPEPVLLPQAAVSSFQRRPAEHPSQDLEANIGLIADSEELIAAYEAMYVEGGTDPTGTDGERPTGTESGGEEGSPPAGSGTTPDDYRRQLQSALSVGRNPDDRVRSLVQVTEAVGRELEVISLPDAQPVTMAAREGSIPLVVESRAAGPRLIMLQFRSDKVNVGQDAQMVVVEPGTSSIDVQVEARSLGTSQVDVSIRTPDGTRVLATNRLEIRSTAVPGLGLLISVTAVVLLIVWWYIDYRRGAARRVEQKAAAVLGHPSARTAGSRSDGRAGATTAS